MPEKSRPGKPNKDDVMIELLARGESQTAVAKLAGSSLSTVRRRLLEPDFRQRIAEYRSTLLDAASGKLTAVFEDAVNTLKTLTDTKMPANVRLAAARSIIELTLKVRDAVSMDERLAAIEQRVDAIQTTHDYSRLNGISPPVG